MKKLTVNNLKLYWLIAIPLVTGCGSLLNKQPLPTNYYSLEIAQSKNQQKPVNHNHLLPSLTVTTPKSDAGYGSRHLLYTRKPHQIEHFSRNEWVDTPAHMLQGLLVAALENTGNYEAVMPKTSAVSNNIRVESQLLTLIQNFDTQPSNVDFRLRVTLINEATNQVIANQLFSEQVIAKSDNPAGGVVAANEAVNMALLKVGIFTAQALKNYKIREIDPIKK